MFCILAPAQPEKPTYKPPKPAQKPPTPATAAANVRISPLSISVPELQNRLHINCFYDLFYLQQQKVRFILGPYHNNKRTYM